MARKKWNANSNVSWDDRTFLRRNWLRLAIAAVLATVIWTLYYRYTNSDAYRFGPNYTQTQREISDCMDRIPRTADDSEADEHAASACVNGMASDKPGDK